MPGPRNPFVGLYYAGRYAEAARAAQAGVDLSPENPQAIRLLVHGCARAYARMGDRAAAEAAIGRALTFSERQQELPVGLTACIDFVPYSVARTLANAITARLSSGDAEAVLADADEIEVDVASAPHRPGDAPPCAHGVHGSSVEKSPPAASSQVRGLALGVREGGLEPPRPKTPAPKAVPSTNSGTRARTYRTAGPGG